MSGAWLQQKVLRIVFNFKDVLRPVLTAKIEVYGGHIQQLKQLYMVIQLLEKRLTQNINLESKRMGQSIYNGQRYSTKWQFSNDQTTVERIPGQHPRLFEQ